jgi:hypothetical protein
MYLPTPIPQIDLRFGGVSGMAARMLSVEMMICTSYGQDLVDKMANDCRTIMTSPWYGALFRITKLAKKRGRLKDFETTEHGYRLSTST